MASLASALICTGLVLAAFGSKAEAEIALAQMPEPALRSARVVIERPELANQWLKFPAVDAQLQARLESLRPALADAPLQPCQ